MSVSVRRRLPAFSDTGKAWTLFAALLLVYVVVRLVSWHNATKLDGHDSVGYLWLMSDFLTLSWSEFLAVDPDDTPFYPFFGALFSLPGWSTEVGARLASLVFSIGLFFALIGIGRRLTTPNALGFGLLIIALNPVLIALSWSIRQEPSYIAVIYGGFWLFLTQYENPTKLKALLLGLIFGLAFINRTEGALYLLAIPAMQFVHFRFYRNGNYSFSRYSSWLVVFILGFSLLALPQVWRVSQNMNTLAINGRQTWDLILNSSDGRSISDDRSFDEKIYGLDYSPTTINLTYLQHNPEPVSNIDLSRRVQKAVRVFGYNLTQLYERRLNQFHGALALIFFSFGLLALMKTRRHYELFLVLAFLGVGLFGPLNWNVVLRHIAIVVPLMLLLAGMGIVYVSELILGREHDT